MNTKEIEISVLSNQITNEFILSENNFGIRINEIILLLEYIVAERKKPEVLNYLNDRDMNSLEIYNWLLNSQNDLNSIYLLGVFNHFGIEINVNKQKAFELYQKAANLRHANGINSLGYCYQKGIGTSINKRK